MSRTRHSMEQALMPLGAWMLDCAKGSYSLQALKAELIRRPA